MRTRRSILAAVVLSLGAAAFGAGARAEVSVETDSAGSYVRTVVLTNVSIRSLRIWSVERTWPYLQPLNPDGDLNGDLWPAIAENPMVPGVPWVVWSRHTGSEYDLAWSRWTPGGWSGIAFVQDAAFAGGGNDLDPVMAFDRDGQALLVWWRDEGGIGCVWATAFQDGRWMEAFRVSDPGVDSRSPGITVLDDGQVQVDFDTPQGHDVRNLAAYVPFTITDDIDPIYPTATSSGTGVVPKTASSH